VEYFVLRGVLINDYEPLLTLPLRLLHSYDNTVRQLEVISRIRRLSELFIDGDNFNDPSQFTSLTNLRTLHLRKVPLKTLRGFEEFQRLEVIYMSEIPPGDGDYTPLLGIPNLKAIYMRYPQAQLLYMQIPEPPFEVIIG
jgi:hypothetical protein